MSGKNFRHISSLFAEIKNVKVLKNALCFNNDIFGCNGNKCYVILINAFLARYIV